MWLAFQSVETHVETLGFQILFIPKTVVFMKEQPFFCAKVIFVFEALSNTSVVFVHTCRDALKQTDPFAGVLK